MYYIKSTSIEIEIIKQQNIITDHSPQLSFSLACTPVNMG